MNFLYFFLAAATAAVATADNVTLFVDTNAVRTAHEPPGTIRKVINCTFFPRLQVMCQCKPAHGSLDSLAAAMTTCDGAGFSTGDAGAASCVAHVLNLVRRAL